MDQLTVYWESVPVALQEKPLSQKPLGKVKKANNQRVLILNMVENSEDRPRTDVDFISFTNGNSKKNA